MFGDRNKRKYFYSLLISAIVPFSSTILLVSRPIIAREAKIENSIIYVDSQLGNDGNKGTRNTPLKTITHALKTASDNTIISLAPGNYNESTGEKFPLIIKKNITLKGIDGGQGKSVVIEGNGAFISHSAAEQSVTVAAIKKAAAITGVTITNPDNRGHGLWIESASPQVSDSTFSRSGNTGLSVNGNSKPAIRNNYFHSNGGNGLLVYGTSQPEIIDNIFDSTGFGVSLVQDARAFLENNTFKGNRIAVILEGNSQGTFRNNTIISSLESGLVAIANSKADLGFAANSGNNVFRSNKKLDIQNLTAHTVSATGTEISGQTVGNLDFSNDARSLIASGQTQTDNITEANFSRLRNNPLPQSDRPTITKTGSNKPQPAANNPPESNTGTLPPPPQIANSLNPVTEESEEQPNPSDTKEYVFSAPETENNTSTSQASSLNYNANGDNINSLSDVLAVSSPATIKYRVLAEASDSSQKSAIKSLYPQAFNTVYQGKSMMQIGAFSDRAKAEAASNSLTDLGLNSYILDK